MWLYRIRPSVVHERFVEIAPKGELKGDFADSVVDPNQMRWRPLPLPAAADRRDFVDGEAYACVRLSSPAHTVAPPLQALPPCSARGTR